MFSSERNPLLHDEKELLRLVARGDAKAFRRLFEVYYDPMYSTSLMYTKVHELAEDVVQQAFLRIWEKRGTLETIDQFGAYLFIIARNETINILRKQSSHRTYIQHIRELFDTERDTPEEQMIIKQKRALLHLAVENLPPQQRLAYRLSREKGLSYEEIAADMRLSINTVKGHVSAALRSIREFLQRHRKELTLLLASWLLS